MIQPEICISTLAPPVPQVDDCHRLPGPGCHRPAQPGIAASRSHAGSASRLQHGQVRVGVGANLRAVLDVLVILYGLVVGEDVFHSGQLGLSPAWSKVESNYIGVFKG